MADFYISPQGNDSAPGTIDHPFATLERAQAAAREVSCGVVIHFRAGTHLLTQPIELTGDDSGRSGHRAVYQAFGYGTANMEHAIISGGRVITGWKEHNGVWLAEVGDLDTRQLYVNGCKVERAGIDGLPGEASRTATGYITDSTAPLNWHAPSAVEFVYRGVYPWTEARCGVATVAHDGESTVVAMAQPAFGRAIDLYNSAWNGQVKLGPGLPTRVENDLVFLTEPGSFVLDRSQPGNHLLHYLPRPGEDPSRTHVVAPALERLLRVTGTCEISFKGLVFADATWLQPNSGFLHYHGSSFYDGEGAINKVHFFTDEAWVTVPTNSKKIPACISLEETSGVWFEGCRFTRLGANALGAYGGADLTVLSCHFDTLAASAITVTGSQNTRIEDNFIQHVGLDYSGSPGIVLQDTVGCTVTHNQVTETSHCGIVAYPGRGTRISHNLVARTMSVLADGGGIYLSGSQGDSAGNGAVVNRNVIKDTLTPYNFGLYTDYGAAWVTVKENVVLRADNTAVLKVSPPMEHVIYQGNFWDADPIGSDDVPEGVAYEGNTTLAEESALHAATSRIQAEAGLLRAKRW